MNRKSGCKDLLSTFKNTPRLVKSNGVKARRYYDNINAFQKGRFLTNKVTANPIRDLVLYNNQATMTSEFIIKSGAKYLTNIIVNSLVNAIHYFVPDLNWLIKSRQSI